MSGAALVAAAYACGCLEKFKQTVFSLNKDNIKQYIVKNPGKGGFYSLDPLEETMLKFTKGRTFEEVRPRMAFVCVDIENGQQIALCMGDIARAARISCTLPGAFEPVLWGGRPLVDGGLLNSIPVDVLKNAGIDFTIGINMRGTKHIFTEKQISIKKVLNFIKKVFFIEELEHLFSEDANNDSFDFSKKPGMFSILGKSLDVVIKANQEKQPEVLPDVLITPNIPLLKRTLFSEERITYYYDMGRKSAEEYAPKILQTVNERQKIAA